MKKSTLLVTIFSMVFFIFAGNPSLMYSSSVIDKIKPTADEIPEGYMFGQIPKFAQNVLKSNPWNLDHAAIKKLANRIYPGGNSDRISEIHMTIMAEKKNPYRDDIVCYILLFKDNKSAVEEINKLNEYANYNNDRAVVIEKNNIAVFIFTDKLKNYEYVKKISASIKKKIESL